MASYEKGIWLGSVLERLVVFVDGLGGNDERIVGVWSSADRFTVSLMTVIDGGADVVELGGVGEILWSHFRSRGAGRVAMTQGRS